MTINCRIITPGKLLIAGEYAILEPGNQSVVVAVDRYVTVSIEEDTFFHLTIKAWFPEKIRWRLDEGHLSWLGVDSLDVMNRLAYIKEAIEVAHDYLGIEANIVTPYALDVTSDLDERTSGRKYGLGSSGAVVVSVMAAVLNYFSKCSPMVSQEDLFKLAYIAHYRTQGNGSGVDIAASVYGGWLHYVPVNSTWIRQAENNSKCLKTLVSKPWPELLIAPLTPPPSMHLMVGWTGKPVATGPMIEKYLAVGAQDREHRFKELQEIREIMETLLFAFETGDQGLLLTSIQKHRRWLQALDDKGGIGIETPELKNLCDLADRIGAGKTSGAGGGDCGIAMVTSTEQRDILIGEWLDVGIQYLELKVSEGTSIVINESKGNISVTVNNESGNQVTVNKSQKKK